MPTAYVSLGEACERLRVPPRTFRQLMADFGDLLAAPRPSADGKLQELPAHTVDSLHDILAMRQRGRTIEEIRDWLAAEPAAGPPAAAEVVDAAGTAAASGAAAAAGGEAPATAPAAGADPSPAGPETGRMAAAGSELLARQADLLAKLEELTSGLSQTEKQRVDDRDRLLTVLMRTQIEIQQLRHTLAASASRRDRRKRGWASRLFG